MLYATPEEHAANPPSTWRVVKVPRDVTGGWAVTDASGTARFSRYRTQRDAILALTTGEDFYVRLWLKERHWYAGEPVEGWKPYVRPVTVSPV